MGNHTPGPWEARASRFFNVPDSQQYLIVATEKETICRMTASNGPDGRELAMPDARLIAAAPDMISVLEELEESCDYWSEYDVPLGIVDRIKAAIAKAKGGA